MCVLKKKKVFYKDHSTSRAALVTGYFISQIHKTSLLESSLMQIVA